MRQHSHDYREDEELPKRIIDEKVEEQLDAFGAALLPGPKWSGKTTTSEYYANSAIYLDDYDRQEEYEMINKSNVGAFLLGESPHLIDEWQTFPKTGKHQAYRFDEDLNP